MLNFFTKRINRKNKKGFTLIELIVVIAIVAIIAAIGIPAIAGQVAKAKLSSMEADAKSIALEAQRQHTVRETSGATPTLCVGATIAADVGAKGYTTITLDQQGLDKDGNDTAVAADIVTYRIDEVSLTKGTVTTGWKRT